MATKLGFGTGKMAGFSDSEKPRVSNRNCNHCTVLTATHSTGWKTASTALVKWLYLLDEPPSFMVLSSNSVIVLSFVAEKMACFTERNAALYCILSCSLNSTLWLQSLVLRILQRMCSVKAVAWDLVRNRGLLTWLAQTTARLLLLTATCLMHKMISRQALIA